MFGFTKVVKLMGLFRRNPGDVVFLPLSIVFGYFHGLVKLYALYTLNMVSFGSCRWVGRACSCADANADLVGQPGGRGRE